MGGALIVWVVPRAGWPLVFQCLGWVVLLVQVVPKARFCMDTDYILPLFPDTKPLHWISWVTKRGKVHFPALSTPPRFAHPLYTCFCSFLAFSTPPAPRFLTPPAFAPPIPSCWIRSLVSSLLGFHAGDGDSIPGTGCHFFQDHLVVTNWPTYRFCANETPKVGWSYKPTALKEQHNVSDISCCLCFCVFLLFP